ncbi:MAG: DUF4422 domain-containing protein [Lachnospiraceae bacterium]|nr:DUF4422 domain-containing protein [Lachnospiraceae bacterium]
MYYYIFGAHSRGYTLYEYLRVLEPHSEILGFLFNNDECNPSEIEGITVKHISNCKRNNRVDLDFTARVYVATRGVYHSDITNILSGLGFIDIICVTPELDMSLRNKYVEKAYDEKGRSFVKINDITGKNDNKNISEEFMLYIAKTATDKSFLNDIELHAYESIIQVGCSLTEIRLNEANYFDSIEGISKRNHQFCELTGLYWIWKHATQDIIGLEHWRRRFILPDNWTEIMLENDIDVILPVPLCVMPSLLGNYKSRHNPDAWDKCMDILEKHHPTDYYSAIHYFADNRLYSPCNMIIAKREILNEYCEWLFPVLLELNDTVGTLEDSYQNRYPGFIAERLLNYYFDKKKRSGYKIVYADKNFIK